jgi:3-oxoacyl-[acyl-carrier protein] reductase
MNQTTQETPTRPFAGRTAIVTGSGQNIGRDIVLAFAAGGANVVVNGAHSREKVDRVVAEARALGAQAIGVMADVGDPQAMQGMVDQCIAAFGSADIVVSNVSVRHHRPFLEITPEQWDQTLRTNLGSCFYLARAAIPHMQKRGWGRIVHISGRDGFFVKEHRAHNVAAKAGMHALAKVIALEFGPYGITANTVAPGLMDTVRNMSDYPDFDYMMTQRLPAIPARRIGTGGDIANACLYLCSDGAGFVTGQLLQVNGGEFMY